MSHIRTSPIHADLPGTLCAVSEVLWLLPLRLYLAIRVRVKDWFGFPSSKNAEDADPRTSIWLAFATSIFAPFLAYNWHLLLARPHWGINEKDGLIFPPDDDDLAIRKDRGEKGLGRIKDERYGFYGFLYVSDKSPSFGKAGLEGADAVWIHAHGGGFYAGEARQYHHTYKRWAEKAFEEFGMDLRILAVEYRECLSLERMMKLSLQ